jgi:predicted ATP-grasp superfamily ATP-dependent carboligase
MEISLNGPLDSPVVVAAFEGWNDAGEAASSAVAHLAELSGAREIGAVDPEEFYDYQVNRPMISLDERGASSIEWRTTRLLAGRLPDARDLVLIRGIEPSIRWRGFTREILSACQSVGASTVVLLGALLADTPHGRDLPVAGVSESSDLTDRLRLEPSTYAGPTGILGVLAEALGNAGLPVVSYWASVPYYVSQPPNPKAVLALLRRVEEAADIAIDTAELPEESLAWERAVDEMVADDEELAEMVGQLEAQTDSDRLESASGDSIAEEFERYLRRRRSEGSG